MAGVKRSSKEPCPVVLCCTKCGEELPFTEEFFKRDKQSSWGLTKECKTCLKARETARRKSNMERERQVRRAWYERNREKAREFIRRNARKRADKVAAYGKEWRKRNPHKLAEYYAKSSESRKVWSKRWRDKNKEKTRSYSRNYQTRKTKAGGSHTDLDILRIGSHQKWKCAACRINIKNKYHVDHIVPVACGGDSNPLNLQLLCPTCNRKKGAKDPLRFMREIGFLL